MLVALQRLYRDEAGFVLSAELMLIATIVSLAVIVGLSEVSLAINSELNDVARSFGAVNQGFNAGGGGGMNDFSPQNFSEIGGVDPQPEQ